MSLSQNFDLNAELAKYKTADEIVGKNGPCLYRDGKQSFHTYQLFMAKD